MATLRRIGWCAVSDVHWIMHTGVMIDVREWSPLYVGRLVDLATAAGLGRAFAASVGDPALANGVWWEASMQPLRAFPPPKAGYLRRVLSGTAWPQQRLFGARRAETPNCAACGVPADVSFRR